MIISRFQTRNNHSSCAVPLCRGTSDTAHLNSDTAHLISDTNAHDIIYFTDTDKLETAPIVKVILNSKVIAVPRKIPKQTDQVFQQGNYT